MEPSNDHELQVAEETPDINGLRSLWAETVTDIDSHSDLQRRNYRTRQMIWDGQTDDGRKHAITGSNKTPFPWAGASDLRVPVVDDFINFGVALDCIGLQKANIRAVPVEVGDLAKAAVISNFMRWLVMSQMEELAAEAEILANYRRERGLGILGVFWEKRQQLTQMKVSLQDIARTMPDVAAAIQQGIFEAELVKIIQSQVKGTSAKKARRMIKELREVGETTIPYAVEAVNRPMVYAYAVGDDLFLPPNTPSDLQKARAIFVRSYMSPEQLREKAVTLGWNEEYVDKAIATTLGDRDRGAETENIAQLSQDRVGLDSSSVSKGLVEVVKAYRRMSDEDGVPGIYCTVFFPACKGEDGSDYDYAKHELLGDRHGKYPFVAFPRERTSRLLLDTRGEAEVGKCWQDAIKVEMDGRIDHASISVCPPTVHPHGRQPGRLGPGTFLSEKRPGEYRYMDPPAPPSASREVHATLVEMARSYHGLPTTPEKMTEALTKQQYAVTKYLQAWQLVFRMVWSDYKQFGPDEQFFRVIGANEAQSQKFSKAEMDDKVDFYLAFDVLNNDPEAIREKIKAFMELAASDQYGVVDMTELLSIGFNMIDPMVSDKVVLPKAVAAQKEIKDTQDDIAKMTSGIDIDVPEKVNAELRTQVMQRWMQGTPDNPAVDVQASLQQNPSLQKRVERYMKQLEFVLTQQQNAQTGRKGTVPAGATG
jgi:hypothetical protein